MGKGNLMPNRRSGVTIDCIDRSPLLTFQRVPEPKSSKARIHLDVQVDDIESGRRQVESLGGRWSGNRHGHGGRGPRHAGP
jgi:hypothetical protein